MPQGENTGAEPGARQGWVLVQSTLVPLGRIKSWHDGLFDDVHSHAENLIQGFKARRDIPEAVKRRIPARTQAEKAERFRKERLDTGSRWLFLSMEKNDIAARRAAGRL